MVVITTSFLQNWFLIYINILANKKYIIFIFINNLFLETLEDAIENSIWKEQHYPHLCAPFSPCVTLQWTYRDGKNNLISFT